MKLSKSNHVWSAMSAAFVLAGFLSTSLAQTPAQPVAPMTVAQAEAALAQAKAQSKIDFQSVVDCRPLTGPERGQCNHEANAQIVAINRRLADAQKAVTKAQYDEQRQAIEAADAPRRAQADADRQAALAARAERQQAAAEANAKREQAAAAARAEEAARIAKLPPAGPIYTRQMADLLKRDSLGWAMNHLDPGSVGNVRVYAGSVNTGNFILRTEYTFNGGSHGWAVVQYSGGKFNCIEFWDSIVGCRSLRQAGEGQRNLASILKAASVASSDSGSTDPSLAEQQKNAAEFGAQQRRDADYQKYNAPQ